LTWRHEQPAPPPTLRLRAFLTPRRYLEWSALALRLQAPRLRSCELLWRILNARASSPLSKSLRRGSPYSFLRSLARSRGPAQTLTSSRDECFRWQPCPGRPAVRRRGR